VTHTVARRSCRALEFTAINCGVNRRSRAADNAASSAKQQQQQQQQQQRLRLAVWVFCSDISNTFSGQDQDFLFVFEAT